MAARWKEKTKNPKHFIYEKKKKKLPKAGGSFFPRSNANSINIDVDDDFSYFKSEIYVSSVM